MKYKDTIYAIDAIGVLRAKVADLQAQIKPLEAQLKGCAEGYYEGDLFGGTVFEVFTDRVNWKAIAEKLNPSRQLVVANTKRVKSVRLTVVARKKDAA